MKSRRRAFFFILVTSCSLLALTEQPEQAKGFWHNTIKKTRRFIKWAVWGENFHVVEPGQVYRSSQLSPERLDHYINEYKIKTIINLRGKSEHKAWWQQETKLAQKLGVAHFDIDMNARILTPEEKLKQLIILLLTAPRPMLIHCRAGSDRTGEAIAILELLNGKSTEAALKQLSLKYGHFYFIFPEKRRLIRDLETIYPGILDQMKQIATRQFSVHDILQNKFDAQKIYEMLLKRVIPQGRPMPL